MYWVSSGYVGNLLVISDTYVHSGGIITAVVRISAFYFCLKLFLKEPRKDCEHANIGIVLYRDGNSAAPSCD